MHSIDILAAGDLLNTSDPDPQTMSVIMRQLDRSEYGDVNLYFTSGQHERHRSGYKWLGAHNHPIDINEKTAWLDIISCNFEIYGIDWRPAPELPAAIATIPKTADLIMCHQVWSEFKVSGSNAEGSLSDIPGTALILTGDYHVSKIINVGSHTVLSPGSICMQSIDESPEKFFYVLRSDMSLEPIQLSTRSVGHYEITTPEDLETFLFDKPWESLLDRTGLPPYLQRPLVSVTFDPKIPFIAKTLTDTLGSIVHYFPSPIFTKSRDVSGTITVSVPYVSGLVDALETVLPVASELHAPLKQLLTTKSTSLSSELASIKRNFLESWQSKNPQSESQV